MKSSSEICCPVVELRQYTLHPGARDTLIALFEREFVETQEALGMRIIGTFRDLDRPDRFVWLRGFETMEARAVQLQEFYGGPVWKAHREAANATMIDSDNVLLLRPIGAAEGFRLKGSVRAEPGSAALNDGGLIVAVIFHVRESESEKTDSLGKNLAELCRARGLAVLGTFVTAHYENSFPALPVRAEANVVILFFRFADRAALEKDYPVDEVIRATEGLMTAEAEMLFLAPTARSLLRGS